ncbi:MAG TPA: FAD-binding protein [Mycobacteriales bacterium]|nr:FAD-binding protein [Mycobacteriales bacterium]
MTGRPTNWAGNVRFAAASRHRPASVPELQALVARADRVRAVGGGHSFSDVADTSGSLVSTLSLPPVLDLDTERASVRVAAGVTYTDLARYLDQRGFALRTLASLPHLTVGGACATGTHGSGVATGSLATAVTGMELVTAGGDLVTLTEPGAVVHLGALGVVTSLTLELVPAYEVRQWVLDDLPLAALDEHLDAVLAAAYSVSVFTDWQPDRRGQVWLKQRVGDPPPPDLPATPADGPRHPVGGMPTGNCTVQLGVPGPWYDRLPHFRADAPPSSSGAELQSEYLVGRAGAVGALHALAEVADRVAPVLQTCEIRAVAADELWLSPFHRRDSVGLHFTWVPDLAAVLPVIGLVERQLAPYRPRPHWGKIFTVDPAAVRAAYPRLADFRALVARYDPDGKFGNGFTGRYL